VIGTTKAYTTPPFFPLQRPRCFSEEGQPKARKHLERESTFGSGDPQSLGEQMEAAGEVLVPSSWFQ